MRKPSLPLGLKKLYGKLLGRREYLLNPPKRILRLEADRAAYESAAPARAQELTEIEELLPHVEAVLLYVEPSWNPADVKPIRPRAPNSDIPPQGWGGAAIEVLRDASHPMTIAEIVRCIADDAGIAIDTTPRSQKAHTAVNNAIKHSFGDVLIRHPGRPERFELRR